MKTFYTLCLLFVSLTSFSQIHYVYTANTNGNWSDVSIWTVSTRNDNMKKDRFVIPSTVTVTADRDHDYLSLGDIEVIIGGVLQMGPAAEMWLTSNSTIQLQSGGLIIGNGGSQQIMIGSAVKYRGNTDGTITGPLFADRTTTGFSLFTTLSVHFASFSAAFSNGNVQPVWSTSAEINNSYFDIEFSTNGRSWNRIGSVKAAATNNTLNNYMFTHKNVNGAIASYRLKQVDKDGKYDYSTVVVVRIDRSETNVYASNKKIFVEGNSGAKDMVVKVLTMNGQVLSSQKFSTTSSKVTLDVNNLNNGTYVVHVSNKDVQTTKAVMIY